MGKNKCLLVISIVNCYTVASVLGYCANVNDHVFTTARKTGSRIPNEILKPNTTDVLSLMLGDIEDKCISRSVRENWEVERSTSYIDLTGQLRAFYNRNGRAVYISNGDFDIPKYQNIIFTQIHWTTPPTPEINSGGYHDGLMYILDVQPHQTVSKRSISKRSLGLNKLLRSSKSYREEDLEYFNPKPFADYDYSQDFIHSDSYPSFEDEREKTTTQFWTKNENTGPGSVITHYSCFVDEDYRLIDSIYISQTPGGSPRNRKRWLQNAIDKLMSLPIADRLKDISCY